MLAVTVERGFAHTSVATVTARARVSRASFRILFGGVQECFLALIDQETDRALRLVEEAFRSQRCWREALRAGVTSLLVLLDSDSRRARFWLIEVLAAGSWALESRQQSLDRITAFITASWRTPADWTPPPLAARAIVDSVLGTLHTHLITEDPAPMIRLLGPLTGLVMRPYLPPCAVQREITLAEQIAREIEAGQRTWQLPRHTRPDIPDLLTHPRAQRARQCLLYLASHPGASNRQVATGIGIRHPGQISRLLTRLADIELVVQHAQRRTGDANRWRLTDKGTHAAVILKRPAGRLAAGGERD